MASLCSSRGTAPRIPPPAAGSPGLHSLTRQTPLIGGAASCQPQGTLRSWKGRAQSTPNPRATTTLQSGGMPITPTAGGTIGWTGGQLTTRMYGRRMTGGRPTTLVYNRPMNTRTGEGPTTLRGHDHMITGAGGRRITPVRRTITQSGGPRPEWSMRMTAATVPGTGASKTNGRTLSATAGHRRTAPMQTGGGPENVPWTAASVRSSCRVAMTRWASSAAAVRMMYRLWALCLLFRQDTRTADAAGRQLTSERLPGSRRCGSLCRRRGLQLLAGRRWPQRSRPHTGQGEAPGLLVHASLSCDVVLA